MVHSTNSIKRNGGGRRGSHSHFMIRDLPASISPTSGQFGEVFRATLHKGTPGEVLVAVKTTKKNSSEKDKADFLKEMMVMSQILHPNIVRLYGLVVEGEYLTANVGASLIVVCMYMLI